MKIGILELLVETAPLGRVGYAYGARFKKYFASITPQALSVWCRQLGHEVHYATYYGQADPRSLLPEDLDFAFLSAYTLASPLAYALAKIFRHEGTRTAIGGPHARSFPHDCLRFFDYAVTDCDKEVIRCLLRGDFDAPAVVTSGRPLVDFPSVEERMPEIITSVFENGRPTLLTAVPLLSSIGCPYSCNFCVDWKNPYQLLPLERLEADLRFISRRLPGINITFHDPNFAVKFDQMLGLMEKISPQSRNPYIMESSLSIIRGDRLKRLRETNCVFVAPGVESWADYSNKAGVGRHTGAQKLELVVRHFKEIHEYVQGIQANFVFGVDVDQGDEPVELTKEFIRRLPFVYPTVNIPTPFGDTPLYDRYLAEGRILREMPFGFYGVPFLVTTLRHYSPSEYFDRLIEIYSVMNAWGLTFERWMRCDPILLKALNTLRMLSSRQDLAQFRRIKALLDSDRAVRDFHEGESTTLPEYYHRCYEERLGPYAPLLSRADRTPLHEYTSQTRQPRLELVRLH